MNVKQSKQKIVQEEIKKMNFPCKHGQCQFQSMQSHFKNLLNNLSNNFKRRLFYDRMILIDTEIADIILATFYKSQNSCQSIQLKTLSV